MKKYKWVLTSFSNGHHVVNFVKKYFDDIQKEKIASSSTCMHALLMDRMKGYIILLFYNNQQQAKSLFVL